MTIYVLHFQLLDVFGHKSNVSLVFDFMDTDLEVCACCIWWTNVKILKYSNLKNTYTVLINILYQIILAI